VDILRYARLRGLVHNTNRQRKLQARKIDILCNDMVQAHRGILERLDGLSFTNRIHESLIGCTDATEVLKSVSELFNSRFGNCGVAILLLDANGITLHNSQAASFGFEVSEFPSFFTAENVRAICGGNRVCLLPELLELPMQIPPRTVEHVRTAAIPLSASHHDLGVLLLYNSAEEPLTTKTVHAACTIAPAVAKALSAGKPIASHS
jgi:uncharacterized protein YigA (DUF484 family)